MWSWKKSLKYALLTSSLHIPVFFLFNGGNGMGIFIYLIILLPFLAFWSGLFVSHRKGLLLGFPIFYSLIFYLLYNSFWIALAYFYKYAVVNEWESSLIYLLFAFIPSFLGSIIGALCHKNGWLRHPLLLPMIAFSALLISIFTQNAYPYNLMENAPALLYIANTVVFIVLGLLVGFMDGKGFLVPILLVAYFILLFTVQSSLLHFKLPIIYLLSSYLFLLIGRFFRKKMI